jgi:signal transduction histidine kinase
MKIKYKLTAIIMLTSVTSLLLGLAAFIVWEYFDFQHNMVSNLLTHASIVADNSRAAVAFSDEKSAKEILNALRASPSIIHAQIVKSDGTSLAFYNKNPADNSIHILDLRDKDIVFAPNGISLKRDITLDREKIGTLFLQATYDDVKAGVTRTASIGLLIAAAVFCVTLLLSSRLQKIISGPLLKLASVAKVVSEHKDYSIRAVKRSNDEVGHLIDAFNEMLYEIQKRDNDLRNINGKLELHVKQRTTDLVIANRQLEDLNTELKATVSKLTAANKDLSDFAHIAAHDLKAPLRAIGSLAGIVYEDYNETLDEQGKDYLQMLVKRTERMSDLINAILKYSEIGRTETDKEQVDLSIQLPEILETLSIPANIKVTFEDKLPVITVEKTKIIQVFSNLIGNSVKYMDKQDGFIKIGCSKNEKFWTFYVADNGPGIQEKYFDKIFTIFQSLKRRDEIDSPGIGLSVVKKIVELNGGKVWVESDFGRGATFYFIWPVLNLEKKNYEKLETNTVS